MLYRSYSSEGQEDRPDFAHGTAAAGKSMAKDAREAAIARVAEMIRAAERVVVFTGAGVSTESGIPDFRSPGGIWTRFDPEDFTIEKFLSSPETRRKQWRILLEGGLFANASPNAAHHAVAELERLGKLACVITQNVDNLHQKAGNDPARVFELHGNMNRLKCLDCGAGFGLASVLGSPAADVPSCERCGGILKPDIVFFGEALPEGALDMASRHAANCDLLIVIGSSLVVYPAAYIPLYAKRSGAGLVIINRDETSCDAEADVLIRAEAGETMSRILEALKKEPAGCA
ncbi:MAG: NAD-dependent protein deacetylase [Syntrophaceae bacterium PtaU1.Bin231]|nr:MAG: NAD-dependent protein deacetylase [Syntrophaceae bacterium PtaU1.Bin231]